jgi:hypothetical protein
MTSNRDRKRQASPAEVDETVIDADSIIVGEEEWPLQSSTPSAEIATRDPFEEWKLRSVEIKMAAWDAKLSLLLGARDVTGLEKHITQLPKGLEFLGVESLRPARKRAIVLDLVKA